jgi:hypothetical protein
MILFFFLVLLIVLYYLLHIIHVGKAYVSTSHTLFSFPSVKWFFFHFKKLIFLYIYIYKVLFFC